MGTVLERLVDVMDAEQDDQQQTDRPDDDDSRPTACKATYHKLTLAVRGI